MTVRALRLLRVSLNVTDLARATDFYRDALGFAIGAEQANAPQWTRLQDRDKVQVRIARLRLGAQELELAQFDPPGARYPARSTAADLWFQHFAIVTGDMAAAYQRLTQHAISCISQAGPERLPQGSGGVVAYKFRDPDGHPLELIQFPPGVGDPAWQNASPTPTIGIDHSALSVADAQRSLDFYATLGLEPRSRHLNYGPEQDRLDGLANVAVEVIELPPAATPTPHVELLCYRTPRGRPARRLGPAGDIADNRLIFEVQGLAELVQALVSTGVCVSQTELQRSAACACVRDPDGHEIVLLGHNG